MTSVNAKSCLKRREILMMRKEKKKNKALAKIQTNFAFSRSISLDGVESSRLTALGTKKSRLPFLLLETFCFEALKIVREIS